MVTTVPVVKFRADQLVARWFCVGLSANGSCDVADIDAEQDGGHDHTATQA
ncbi:hypothetical protein PF010_g17958 [Phytophthora fragariae]|uniref:Uncharacterized protein n=1 Tax=Phytophthora fragariae TaxID=53985 RepID=A0A6A4BN09_9STRA|nr:hypothetical protein PF011_g25432 [Phytophthora fragariae]KAE9092052.1 hypothetical protein PF010_g17958 [Phytophthora fragariae]KAE9277040.1 hypothetical protein PF001_g25851 [Phytophthora fragariae]